MPAQLISLGDGPSILLDKPILLIGRHPECDIQIDSRKISRRHCCIAQVSDYLVIRDLGSTNGVRINGVRVLEGRLRANDELTIGGSRYRISWEMLPEGEEPGEPRAASKRESERSHFARPDEEDALIEASEEPIPLSEPAVPPPGKGYRRSDSPATGILQPRDPFSLNPPRRADRSSSHIIPENLNLTPSSDLDLGTAGPS
jgi:predicted component of type VI protein secretion system